MLGLAALVVGIFVAIFVVAYCLFAFLLLPFALRALPKDKAERDKVSK